MGPGPANAHPRVLRALSTPLVGQYDPAMTGYMAETAALYRQVFDTANEHTLLVDGTARAGIEAALVSLVVPGERVPAVPGREVRYRNGSLLIENTENAEISTPAATIPSPTAATKKHRFPLSIASTLPAKSAPSAPTLF